MKVGKIVQNLEGRGREGEEKRGQEWVVVTSLERRNIPDYDEVSLFPRDAETQSLNLVRRASARKGEGGSRETRRNLKLFNAVARLKTSRPLSFQRHRSTPPTRFVQPNVFNAHDDHNRGVW